MNHRPATANVWVALSIGLIVAGIVMMWDMYRPVQTHGQPNVTFHRNIKQP
jgi:hypothetical protein